MAKKKPTPKVKMKPWTNSKAQRLAAGLDNPPAASGETDWSPWILLGGVILLIWVASRRHKEGNEADKEWLRSEAASGKTPTEIADEIARRYAGRTLRDVLQSFRGTSPVIDNLLELDQISVSELQTRLRLQYPHVSDAVISNAASQMKDLVSQALNQVISGTGKDFSDRQAAVGAQLQLLAKQLNDLESKASGLGAVKRITSSASISGGASS